MNRGSRGAFALAVVMSSALLMVSAELSAHHGQVSVRPQGLNGAGSARLISDQLLMGYRLSLFSDTLRGAQSDRGLTLGEVSLHSLNLSGSLKLSPSVFAFAQLPLGLLSATRHGSIQRRWGLQDASVGLSYLRRGWGGLQMSFSAGLVAPTGEYTSSAALQTTRLELGEGGEFNLKQYSARLSLGSGLWSALTGVELLIQPLQRLQLRGSLSLILPLNETSDQLSWGSDLSFGLAGLIDVIERLGLGLGLSYQRHGQDSSSRSRARDESGAEMTSPAMTELETSGERLTLKSTRDVISASLIIRAALTELMSCELNAGYPLWRRVDGVQLAEGAQTGLSCQRVW